MQPENHTEFKAEIEILLVEDNPTDAEMTLRALKENKLSNKIHHVEDGEEALDFIFCRNKYNTRDCNQTPGLILLDLKLPRVDGLEVLKTLKENPDKKRIPIVILTSSSEEIDIIKSYNLGANSYIVKPVDFSQFASVIKKLNFYWTVLNNTSIPG